MSRMKLCGFVLTLFVVALVFGAGCTEKPGAVTGSKPTVTKGDFGKTKTGEAVEIYTLTNSNGLEAKIMTYGGTVVSLKVPDKDGNLGDIVLGFDNVSDYEEKSPYFGSLVGRYGNRIAKGKFSLDGKEYTLATNNDENHLHGGDKGFDKVVWDAESFVDSDNVGIKLHYLSKDMEEGYPGNFEVTVTYTLTNADEFEIDYAAVTDKATVCNLTNHSYYNLAGHGSGDILGHKLMINADTYTPVDKGLITTGEIPAVKGTPFDFTALTAIGKGVNADNEQIKFGGGYDHNWVLNKEGDEMSLAVKVYAPATGRVMEIYTTEPGLQFYSGNFLDGTLSGKESKVYEHRNGFCLETQHFPDSPNKPDFPSTTLLPGEKYHTTTVHKFSVE